MSHNTHDLVEVSAGDWKCTSHNFPKIVGVGNTEQRAWEDMNRKIVWFADNYPKEAKENLKYRLTNKLLCMCGAPLEEPPMAVYSGTQFRNISEITNAR